MKRVLAALLLCLTVSQMMGQLTIDGRSVFYDKLTKTYLLSVPESAYGGPYEAPVVLDQGVTNVSINGVPVTDWVSLPLVDGSQSYAFSFKKKGVKTTAKLCFTYLPILRLVGTFNNDYATGQVFFTMPDSHAVDTLQARVKWAGSSTNGQWTHKRSYHLKFVDDDGEKRDVSFFGLRDDNHWRLDAGTVDMIRFRNKAAHDLWADFGTRPYYADKQPNARSWVRGSHVEVFLNDEYRGFYNMTECLDRKQMKLKKYVEADDDDDDDSPSVRLRGMLWKGMEVSLTTLFSSVLSDPANNMTGEWEGFNIVYPDIDDVTPADFSVLCDAVEFVSSSSDVMFQEQVEAYFDLSVLVNYYVFIQVLFAIDNTCKNMLWGCYDSEVDKKLTLAVWDLDVTAGQHWKDNEGYYHCDSIQPENEMEEATIYTTRLSMNQLFNRLKQLTDFKAQATDCYWQLRADILDPDSLVARYESIYRRLEACGALDRETVRWSDTGDIAHRMLDFPGEFDYLCDWLRRRIAYLDTHTFARQNGDVNGDGIVDVLDVRLLIDHILSGAPITHPDAVDFNGDGLLDVFDVVRLINLILAN